MSLTPIKTFTIPPQFEPSSTITLRIGLLLLSEDRSIEREFNTFLAFHFPKVYLFHNRIKVHHSISLESLQNLGKEIEKGFSLIPKEVEVVCFGCTSAEAVLGTEFIDNAINKPQVEERKKATIENGKEELNNDKKKNVVAPFSSVVKGLKTLNIQKIALVTPYVGEVNTKLINELQKAGIIVKILVTFEEERDEFVGKIDECSIRKAVKQCLEYNKSMSDINNDGVEGIFISCTSVRVLHFINDLEREANLPVMSSNLALIWNCLRMGGVKDKVNCGTLFKH